MLVASWGRSSLALSIDDNRHLYNLEEQSPADIGYTRVWQQPAWTEVTNPRVFTRETENGYVDSTYHPQNDVNRIHAIRHTWQGPSGGRSPVLTWLSSVGLLPCPTPFHQAGGAKHTGAIQNARTKEASDKGVLRNST